MGAAYELANAEAYNETCAGIANALWNHRMFLLTGDGKYIDVLERVIYNGVLSGVSLGGDRFFYVNPLASDGVYPFNQGHRDRFPWTGCACCPVNIVRFIPSVPGFAYSTRGRSVYVGLYLSSVSEIPLGNDKVMLRQVTDYPWNGKVRFEVQSATAGAWELKLRIPGWAGTQPVPTDLYRSFGPAAAAPVLKVNGQSVKIEASQGFASLTRTWKRGDVVELELPMAVQRVVANEKVLSNTGRVALERGPLVYCVEGADQGGQVSQLSLSDDAAMTVERRPSLLGGITVLRGQAAESFRREDGSVAQRPVELTAVPYQVWCLRGANPMAVWLPRTADKTMPLPCPTLASGAKVLASHTNPGETVAALNDQLLPAKSGDIAIPRFTWWDHKGTSEWVQYDFSKPTKVASVDVYWFDDSGKGACRVPQSCKLTWFDGATWKPVSNASGVGVLKDQLNRVTFDPVSPSSLRLEVQLQPGFSGGILEWCVSP
jgi:hypothetical protein